VAVFSGMLGVTVFGLVLTPIFYFVIRRNAARKAVKAAPTPTSDVVASH
jgi:multidrug efflux pump